MDDYWYLGFHIDNMLDWTTMLMLCTRKVRANSYLSTFAEQCCRCIMALWWPESTSRAIVCWGSRRRDLMPKDSVSLSGMLVLFWEWNWSLWWRCQRAGCWENYSVLLIMLLIPNMACWRRIGAPSALEWDNLRGFSTIKLYNAPFWRKEGELNHRTQTTLI